MGAYEQDTFDAERSIPVLLEGIDTDFAIGSDVGMEYLGFKVTCTGWIESCIISIPAFICRLLCHWLPLGGASGYPSPNKSST